VVAEALVLHLRPWAEKWAYQELGFRDWACCWSLAPGLEAVLDQTMLEHPWEELR
jgi:hypothetical protein